MKKLFGEIKSFFRKIKSGVEKVFSKPAEFLRQGRIGGMVMCVLLPTLFLLQLVGDWSDTVIPLPLIKLLIPGVLFLAAEVFGLAVKLIFGCKNRSRCYFLLAWLAVAFCSFFAAQLNGVPAGLLISFLLALSFDLLGRCVVGFFKTRRFKQVFGYVTLTAAAAVIVLFAVVLRLDTFGQSRIEAYLAVEEQNDFQEVAGFAQYLENGAYKVSALDYGQGDSADIVTESVDISDLAKREGLGGNCQPQHRDRIPCRRPFLRQPFLPDGGYA